MGQTCLSIHHPSSPACRQHGTPDATTLPRPCQPSTIAIFSSVRPNVSLDAELPDIKYRYDFFFGFFFGGACFLIGFFFGGACLFSNAISLS